MEQMRLSCRRVLLLILLITTIPSTCHATCPGGNCTSIPSTTTTTTTSAAAPSTTAAPPIGNYTAAPLIPQPIVYDIENTAKSNITQSTTTPGNPTIPQPPVLLNTTTTSIPTTNTSLINATTTTGNVTAATTTGSGNATTHAQNTTSSPPLVTVTLTVPVRTDVLRTYPPRPTSRGLLHETSAKIIAAVALFLFCFAFSVCFTVLYIRFCAYRIQRAPLILKRECVRDLGRVALRWTIHRHWHERLRCKVLYFQVHIQIGNDNWQSTEVFPEKLNGRYEHFTHCKDTESVQFYIRARYEQRLFGSQHDGVASTHHTIGAKPRTPKIMRIEGLAPTSLRIEWNRPAVKMDDIVEYELRKSEGIKDEGVVIANRTRQFYYIDENCEPGNTYWYRLRLKTRYGWSRESMAYSCTLSNDGVGVYHISQLPVTCPNFRGRDDAIAKIKMRLQSSDARLFTIYGYPGVGKTELALAIGNEIAQTGKPVFFVSVAGVSSTTDVAVRILHQFGLLVTDKPNKLLHTWLQTTDKELIIIIDNMEDALIPQLKMKFLEMLQTITKKAMKVRLLCTSREKLFLRTVKVEDFRLLPLNEEESTDLLETLTSSMTHAQAKLLAGACVCVPLSIDLMAAQIRNKRDADSLIQELLDSYPGAKDSHKPMKPSDKHSVGVCFKEIFGQLSAEQRKALCALSVFTGTFDAFAAEAVLTAAKCQKQALQFIRTFIELALLTYDTSTKRCFMHSHLRSLLTYETERESVDIVIVKRAFHSHFYRTICDLAKRYYTKNYSLVLEQFKMESHNILAVLKDSLQDEVLVRTKIVFFLTQPLVSSCLLGVLPDEVYVDFYGACLEIAERNGDGAICSYLHTSIADYKLKISDFTDALQHLKEANKLQHAHREGVHPLGRILTLNSLSTAQVQLGGTVEAFRHLHESLSICSRLPKCNDHDIIMGLTYQTLAAVNYIQYEKVGFFSKIEMKATISESYHEFNNSTAKKPEKSSPSPSTSDTMGRIQLQTAIQAAIGANSKALDIFEESLNEHPVSARALDDMARYMAITDDMAHALEHARKALLMREGLLGPYHYDTTLSHFTIGGLLCGEDDYDGALESYKKCLRVRLRTLGDVAQTARCYYKIGALLYRKGDLPGSLVAHRRAAQIREKLSNNEERIMSYKAISNITNEMNRRKAASPKPSPSGSADFEIAAEVHVSPGKK